MCGIAGSFLEGRVTTNLLQDSVAKMSHRGPDETGFFFSPECSLGMSRLSIIDLSSGKQPSFSGDGNIISVFNGEIYNYKQLREELISKGYPLMGNGDSELIPHLYLEHGEDFPRLLQGMFAIALWDKRQQKGMLIRDRVGEKPLWYSTSDGVTYFASELKSLLTFNIRRDIDFLRLREYLHFGYVNAPNSILKDVFQVRPAHIIVFKQGVVREVRYWRPNLEYEEAVTYKEATKRLRNLVEEAVDSCLVSERPVGSFLSGGIDSSLITSVMVKKLGVKVDTFSIGFSVPEFDESQHARRIANYLGTNHHERIINPDPHLILDKIQKVLDVPFADSSLVPSLFLSEFAQERVTVALGGDGGDEVFGGYKRYFYSKLLNDFHTLFSLVPKNLVARLKVNNKNLGKLIYSLQGQSSFDRYLNMQALFRKEELKNLAIDDGLLLENLGNISELWQECEGKSFLTQLQCFDLLTYLPGDLMYKSDISSMASSLELRSPLLNHKIVEFGLAIPDEFKLRGRTSKRILRDVLREYLPEGLIGKKKKGFAIPQAKWLRHEFSAQLSRTLMARDAYIGGWIDREKLEGILREHRNGKDQDRLLWPLFMLELWAQKWL